jgi:hypothetical protein
MARLLGKPKSRRPIARPPGPPGILEGNVRELTSHEDWRRRLTARHWMCARRDSPARPDLLRAARMARVRAADLPRAPQADAPQGAASVLNKMQTVISQIHRSSDFTRASVCPRNRADGRGWPAPGMSIRRANNARQLMRHDCERIANRRPRWSPTTSRRVPGRRLPAAGRRLSRRLRGRAPGRRQTQTTPMPPVAAAPIPSAAEAPAG